MLWKRSLLVLTLIFFVFLTVRAINAHGYLGVIMMFSANPATELLSWDLIISLVLVSIWMVGDARKNGKVYLPFLLITLLFGIAGPLLYLILRGFSPKVQRMEATLVLIGLATYSAVTFPLADLRTANAGMSPSAAANRGRELMRETALAHGLTAWRKHKTLSVEARDVWKARGWWPELDQSLRLHFLLGTFTSQVELTDGVSKGQTWGIQAWTPYRRQSPLDPIQAVSEPAPEIRFFLPTLQYFAELPFRLLGAESLIYQGKASHRGENYERLLATWGATQPNERYDQYQLWINSRTGLIDMVHYTVRDAASLVQDWQKKMMRPLAVGTIHFEDYREVEGVWLPFANTITLQPPQLTRYPLEQHFFHRMEIASVQFDKVSEKELCPLDINQVPSDSKPPRKGYEAP